MADSITSIRGTAVQFYANTGTDGTPVLSAMGGEVDLSYSYSVDVSDITNKASGNWKEHVETFRSATVTFSGHMDSGGAAFDKILNDINSGTAKRQGMKVQTINAEKYTFTGTFTSFEISAGAEGTVDYSGTLETSGAVVIASA